MIKTGHLLEAARETALKAGELLLKGFGTSFDIAEKEGSHNLVTTYDKAAQKSIIGSLFSLFPDHAFLAEEGGVYKESGSDYMWIIDPLDGTVNFAHNIPIFSVSIGCSFKNQVVCGVVYQPMLKELFEAEKGKGATLNGRPLKTTRTPRLDSSILVTGFPYNIQENPLHCIEAFSRITKRGIPIRRLGSAAIDLCYVAAGRFDGYWEVLLEPWDVAAGKLIVEEAGGVVSRYDGSAIQPLERGPVLATNGLIHEALKQELL